MLDSQGNSTINLFLYSVKFVLRYANPRTRTLTLRCGTCYAAHVLACILRISHPSRASLKCTIYIFRMSSSQKIPIDVLCVGHASFDLNFVVSRHPGPDEKATASSLVGCGGGPAVTVARLGYRSAFAGYLGNDLWGEQHFQDLVQAGVLSNLIVRGEASTPLSVALIKPDGQRAGQLSRGHRFSAGRQH